MLRTEATKIKMEYKLKLVISNKGSYVLDRKTGMRFAVLRATSFCYPPYRDTIFWYRNERGVLMWGYCESEVPDHVAVPHGSERFIGLGVGNGLLRQYNHNLI